jgi:spermidine synthase
MNRARHFYFEIFLICFAALLLEISYTRLVSFKLFYYYTYPILGFALLGIGSGGVGVAVLPRLRAMPLERLLAVCCTAGAAAVGAGYFVIALTPLSTRLIWSPGSGELWKLLGICSALFANFFSIGIMVASLLGRNSESIRQLYFADLLGAGVACAVVVPLLERLTPPGCIFLAGLLLAGCGVRLAWRGSRPLALAGAVLCALLLGGVLFPRALPEPVTEEQKTIQSGTPRLFSQWSPVFRVDVTGTPRGNILIIHHDGIFGATLQRFEGDLASLARFEKEERSYPFRVTETPPREVLIIGAAGGHEILASLYFGAEHVTAVELNPVTCSLLTEHFAGYTGQLAKHPRVTLVNDEGRSFLARQRGKFDLIYFVAPDSYSAMNAATAGAFVLSESYLYTVEMIALSLEHLRDDGVIAMHFGEFEYERKPNRTARYVGTVRRALEQLGAADPARHILVATTPSFLQLSTILVKRDPFTEKEIASFAANTARIDGGVVRSAAARPPGDGAVDRVLSLPASELDAWYAAHPYLITPIVDDTPFFWHFSRFDTVLREFFEPLRGRDREDAIGERLLIALIVISGLFAAVFLLLPFVAIRATWRALPGKARSFALFAAIGLGFMFFEISLIQKLTLFLGYPTYSLSVTLMSLLVFTGLGSLATGLYGERRNRSLAALFGAVATLTLFYLYGMGPVVEACLGSPLPLRVALAVLMTAPLGLALGAFMPLGLATVSALGPHREEYVAWGWAVNGFFSVLGSTLTTVLSMTYGFRTVLLLGLLAYGLAAALLAEKKR